MAKSVGDAADDFKAHALPKEDGTFIGADHDVELHGQETADARLVQRMPAHGPGDTAARRPGYGHVSAIGDVRSGAGVVGAQIVRADDFVLMECDKDCVTE